MEDELDEDDYEDDDDMMNRIGRLKNAFDNAKAADFQGYTLATNVSSTERSIQDLTALSWAYFCCENDPFDVLSFRLRALEINNLNQRLSFALTMMMQRKTKMIQLLKSGTKIDSRNEDDEDDDFKLD